MMLEFAMILQSACDSV